MAVIPSPVLAEQANMEAHRAAIPSELVLETRPLVEGASGVEVAEVQAATLVLATGRELVELAELRAYGS